MNQNPRKRRAPNGSANDPPAFPDDIPRSAHTLQCAGAAAGKRVVPPFQQPVQIAHFSWDGDRRLWVNDRRSLHVFAPPAGVLFRNDAQVALAQNTAKSPTDQTLLSEVTDLNTGFPDQFTVSATNAPERLDPLLAAAKETGATADVVTWRGIMTRILTAPFDAGETWTLRATRTDAFGGALLLEEASATDSTAPGAYTSAVAADDDEMRRTYYGYRFEAVSTRAPDAAVAAVNTREQFCSVVRTRLGEHALLLGGEVDAQEATAAGAAGYLELKTHILDPAAPDAERRIRSLERFKFLKTWAQCFLLNVPKIVFGFRDGSGRLLSLQSFTTRELPRRVRGKPHAWDPNECLFFAERFVAWVRGLVPTDAQTPWTVAKRGNWVYAFPGDGALG